MATPSDVEARAEAADADARFDLAIQLIHQADSFERFDRAAALIEDLAALGHAEALCMSATLEAVGAGRRRDWNRALRQLERAAEQGSAHARDQLGLLARMRRPEAGGTQSDETWREARGAIDVEQLLRAPDPIALAERPRLRLFRGFATEAECRWLIDRFRAKLEAAVVVDGTSGESLVDTYRNNSAVDLPLRDMDVIIELLKARISTATRLPEFIFELPQLMHYAVGQEFRPHHDFLEPNEPGFAEDLARRGQRMGTFLIFLNDDFEGGETEFPKAGISFRGRTGDALFFANVTPDGRPDPLTLHAGRPPTRGEKWILSQWIRDRPPPGAAG